MFEVQRRKSPRQRAWGSDGTDLPVPGGHCLPELVHRVEGLEPPTACTVRRTPVACFGVPPDTPLLRSVDELPTLGELDGLGSLRHPLGVDGGPQRFRCVTAQLSLVAEATGNGVSHWFLGVSFSAEGTMGKKPSSEGYGSGESVRLHRPCDAEAIAYGLELAIRFSRYERWIRRCIGMQQDVSGLLALSHQSVEVINGDDFRERGDTFVGDPGVSVGRCVDIAGVDPITNELVLIVDVVGEPSVPPDHHPLTGVVHGLAVLDDNEPVVDIRVWIVTQELCRKH